MLPPPEVNPYASDESRRRRDAILRHLNERGDELRARAAAWEERAAAGDSEAEMVRQVIVDEVGWLLELAEMYELNKIDRDLRRMAAELGEPTVGP
jgi:hypothetical protein